MSFTDIISRRSAKISPYEWVKWPKQCNMSCWGPVNELWWKRNEWTSRARSVDGQRDGWHRFISASIMPWSHFWPHRKSHLLGNINRSKEDALKLVQSMRLDGINFLRWRQRSENLGANKVLPTLRPEWKQKRRTTEGKGSNVAAR